MKSIFISIVSIFLHLFFVADLQAFEAEQLTPGINNELELKIETLLYESLGRVKKVNNWTPKDFQDFDLQLNDKMQWLYIPDCPCVVIAEAE